MISKETCDWVAGLGKERKGPEEKAETKRREVERRGKRQGRVI